MATKRQSASAGHDRPAEVFRQFAWHLAGSLAATGAKAGDTAAAKPDKGRGGR